MDDKKKKEFESMVEKLKHLDDTSLKIIKIKTEALYERQLLETA
jgi:uncharacterized Zn finger protein